MQAQEEKYQDQNSFTTVFKSQVNGKKKIISAFKKPLFTSTQRVYNWHSCVNILCWKGHSAFVSPDIEDRR